MQGKGYHARLPIVNCHLLMLTRYQAMRIPIYLYYLLMSHTPPLRYLQHIQSEQDQYMQYNK